MDLIEGAAAAATHGSDTSIGASLLNPRLLGYGVEPMADAQASISLVCTQDGLPYRFCSGYSTSGIAKAVVNHRVIQRGSVATSPGLQSFFDQLERVPAFVDDRLSTVVYDSCPPGASCCLGETSGHVPINLTPSRVDRELVFPLSVSASAQAVATTDYADMLTGSAQAVADPFLYVDPGWRYSSYFMVQQESLPAARREAVARLTGHPATLARGQRARLLHPWQRLDAGRRAGPA